MTVRYREEKFQLIGKTLDSPSNHFWRVVVVVLWLKMVHLLLSLHSIQRAKGENEHF